MTQRLSYEEVRRLAHRWFEQGGVQAPAGNAPRHKENSPSNRGSSVAGENHDARKEDHQETRKD